MRVRNKWLIGTVAVVGLAGWGLTSAVQKVQLAVARTTAL